MGITIHYSGIIGPEKYPLLEEILVSQCKANSWHFDKTIQMQSARHFPAKFFKRKSDRPRIDILPHPECEPLMFQFDYDWSISSWVKTQFAPSETHVQIVELLQLCATYFSEFDIVDEGEYAETGSLVILQEHREHITEMLSQYFANGGVGPLKMDDGRIVDCMFPEK